MRFVPTTIENKPVAKRYLFTYLFIYLFIPFISLMTVRRGILSWKSGVYSPL